MSTGVVEGKAGHPVPSTVIDAATAAPDTPAGPSSPARWRRSIAPGVLLALGLGAAVGSWQLRLGALPQPGPGLWPFAVSVLVVLCSLVLLVRPGDDPVETWARQSWSVAAGIGVLAAFILLFGAVGFMLPAVLMLAVWLRVFGGESWRSTTILAVAGPAALYVIFDNLLGVPLPDDVLLRVFS